MTARIEPSEITARDGGELSKRQHVPFRVLDNCPVCGDEHVVDLGAGYHLSYAKQGKPTSVYFSCAKCGDHEWHVWVVARVSLELFNPGIQLLPVHDEISADAPVKLVDPGFDKFPRLPVEGGFEITFSKKDEED